MNRTVLDELKSWFSRYCRGFYAEDAADNRNYLLKEQHTYRVCENINLLTGSLALAENERLTAEAIALFHDLGRFEQYRRHKTFRDAISVNHAALGVQVLSAERVLEDLPTEERSTIFRAVTLHNAYLLPSSLDERELFFTRLVRDADKLDIWEVFISYYELPEEERASAVGLGFPDLPECSPGVVECLNRREMVHLSALKTLTDFKLLQLSWVFDLNFPAAFRLVLERDCLGRLAATLPPDAAVRSAVQLVREFAARRAALQ